MKNYLFGWTNIRTIIKELYKTLSSEKSYLSSKRVERCIFTLVSLGLVIGTFIYLVVEDKLTSTDTIILVSPLLIAAGYNMAKTEKSKEIPNEQG